MSFDKFSGELLLPSPPPCVSHRAGNSARIKGCKALVEWLADHFGIMTRGQKSGLIVPLETRSPEATGIDAFKTEWLPYMVNTTVFEPVKMFLQNPERIRIAGFRLEPELPWPYYTDAGEIYVNLYKRPELPTDGDARFGHQYLANMLPVEGERNWYKKGHGHRLLHPEIPGPSVMHIAQDLQGVGRGAWFKFLTSLYGHWYVTHLEFSDIISTMGQAVFNEWMGTSILVLVNETYHEDNHKFGAKRMAVERMKLLIDTSRQPRWLKNKWIKAYKCLCGPAFEFASNHAIPVPRDAADRRVSNLENGRHAAPEFYAAFDRWASDPRNVGAFRLSLERDDLTGYNPYEPFQTRLGDVATEDSRSPIDEAIDIAREILPGEIVQPHQVIRAIAAVEQRYHLHLPGISEWRSLVQREVRNKGRRISHKDGPNWRPKLPGHERDGAYAWTAEHCKKWGDTIAPHVQKELLKNERVICKLTKSGGRVPTFKILDGGLAEEGTDDTSE